MVDCWFLGFALSRKRGRQAIVILLPNSINPLPRTLSQIIHLACRPLRCRSARFVTGRPGCAHIIRRQDERPVLDELVQEVCGREPAGGGGRRRHGGRRRERGEPGQVLRGGGGGEGGHARLRDPVQASAVDERGDQDGARGPRHQVPPLPHGRRRGAGPEARQGRQGQARGARQGQRQLPQGPRLRPRLLHRPHPHLRRRRPRQEAQGHHGRLPGAEDEDGGGVQGDGGAAVLHGDGGARGGEHDRVAHLVGGERVVHAEGDPGPRARAGDGHHLGDPGAARRRQGDRAQPHGPAPGVPRHGGARRGAGTPAQRHREPRGARQLLRAQGHRRARDGARDPEGQPQVDVLRRPRRHRHRRRPRHARAHQPPHLDAQMISNPCARLFSGSAVLNCCFAPCSSID